MGARVVHHRERSSRRNSKWPWYLGAGISLALLGAILYGAVSTVISVPTTEWGKLITLTPSLLIDLGYDYLRVAVISLVSVVIAITLGYYLAVNAKAERLLIPVMQALLAIPAPLYFPLLVGFSLPWLSHILGWLSAEFYVLLMGFVSAFYYVFFSFWIGVKSIPQEYWELTRNIRLGFWTKMRKIVLPSAFPYMVAGLSSTIDSIWGGLTIAEYWPDLLKGYTLTVHHGLMAFLDQQTTHGNLSASAWASLVFGLVVVTFSILFTRRMMDLARKKYVMEEGIFAA
nr:ABC transporter permease subunit [Sulfodiicoccus acidiphilus]